MILINKNNLKEVISKKGIKNKYLAEQLNISASNFSNKFRFYKFTIKELCEIYNIRTGIV